MYLDRMDRYNWDENKALLSSLVKSCKLQNDKVKIRLPIQKGLLEMILFEVERYYSTPQPYLECLYKTIFLLAYYGMLRVGEITFSDHTVKAGHIHIADNKQKLMMVLYTSKTHGQESKPQRIKISVAAKEIDNKHRFFCPISSTITYMDIRGPYIEESDPFLPFY